MITAQQIREKFVTYFEENGHQKLSSSSLIPQNDPTLLFANAGMNQFKDYFTGKSTPSNKRAVTIQKCVRAGGKHNDLENVGFTARHHTFFEMLGNFSFGDYFKEEAIAMAWKFLTEEMKLPKDKLYVTVHKTDEDARQIWHKQEGVPLDRIFYRDDKDNFWEMGDVGPCGPCSEIFYDHGQQYTDGADTSDCILDDEGRYVEIWNLVFMQYEKFIENGESKRRDLPNPSIDTGAGLERLTACVQNVYWNYDTDIFNGLKSAIEKLSNKKYDDPKYQTSIRVICDHIRSSVMLITDGVIPSNEGRGYVLRRIIRRAVRHMSELGLTDVSFYKLAQIVLSEFSKEYSENAQNLALAEKLLKIEEEKFRQTLKTGLELINKEIDKLNSGDVFSGETAFKLYDTYGFPLDLTETILREKDITLDSDAFTSKMKEQKEKSKATSKFTIQEDNLKTYYKIQEDHGDCEFLGYTQSSATAKLIAVENEGDFVVLVFDQSPMYPEGGGQVGDKGIIVFEDQPVAEVIMTKKPVDGVIAHYCKIMDAKNLIVGNEFDLHVDILNQELSARHHSATHLLQSALIEVLGDHVKQAGSRVSSESLRFDFTHPEAVSQEQLSKVEALVNEKINCALPVSATYMTKDEATEKGAMALFGEKYSDEVRVLEMGDFSLELCGGIHVKNTKEIGAFVITIETSLASGVRRIEALASTQAISYLMERSSIVTNLERALSSNSQQVISKVESLQVDIKNKNKEIKKLKDQLQAQAAKDLFGNKEAISDKVTLVSVNLENGNPKEFRGISDKFVDQDSESILLLTSTSDGKISYLLRTHKKNKELNCSTLLKGSQEIVSGRGGGRPDMAQGSGDAGNQDQFIVKIKELLKEL